MKTCAEAVQQAREILLDTSVDNGYRYSDSDLLQYLWEADQLARTLRPDMYVGRYLDVPPDSYALTDPFPLPDRFFAATYAYMSGRAELRDTEYSVTGRAAAFISAMTISLVKGV